MSRINSKKEKSKLAKQLIGRDVLVLRIIIRNISWPTKGKITKINYPKSLEIHRDTGEYVSYKFSSGAGGIKSLKDSESDQLLFENPLVEETYFHLERSLTKPYKIKKIAAQGIFYPENF